MQEVESGLRASKIVACLVFITICSFVAALGTAFYQRQYRAAEMAVQDNLHMAQELYQTQIAYWRSQHITTIRMLASSARLRRSVALYLAAQRRGAALEVEEAHRSIVERLQVLNYNHEYHAALVTDSQGTPLIVMDNSGSTSHIPTFTEDISPQDARLCLEMNEPIFSSIYFSGNTHTHQHMNLLMPLQLEYAQDTFTVLLVLIIDPESFLMPLLKAWPLPRATAEAVLVRRHGESIMRLTRTRFKSGEPLQQIIPPSGINSIGKLIQEGTQGFVQCLDYRQAKVYAHIAAIPASPWMLVTKVDKSEVVTPIKRFGWYMLTISTGVMGVSGLFILMWWRQHKRSYYEQIRLREREHNSLSQRFDNLSRYANDIILLCSADGKIVDANERALSTYQYAVQALQEMTLRQLCDVDDSEWEALLLQLEHGDGIKFECYQQRADGENFPVEISAGWVSLDDEPMLQAIIRDISERREAEERLHKQAYYDALTGLPNRSLAVERLHSGIRRAQRNNTQIALLFVDLDLFKHINDTLGHVVGDQVLVLFAQRISQVMRSSDQVARFGADEFLIQVENVKCTADIISVVDKVVESIGEPVNIEGFEISSTVSIGISIAPDDGTDVNKLIRYADTAMYRAKARGRNCFQFFTADMHQSVERRLGMEGALRHAVERGELQVYYQPQVDLRTERVTGCEALVRWIHPEKGIVAPHEFIDLAEEIGIIHEIGAWVMDEACRQMKLWHQAGYSDLSIAVNVSPRQLQNRHLAEEILEIVAKHDLNPRSLEVEITETSLMHDPAGAVTQMCHLNQGGVSLAIDDFGTGYSSLGHLHRFPIDKLKIDRSFVMNVDEKNDPNAGTIPRVIIGLAHELGIKIIAEGIETPIQRDFLVQENCLSGQGYLYSKPLPALEFSEFLEQTNGAPVHAGARD